MSLQYVGLRAVLVNCSLTRDPDSSHTGRLLDVAHNIMQQRGVEVDRLHLATEDVPPGIYPDLTGHGWSRDPWPDLWPRFLKSSILVIGTPIWLGEQSSLTRVLIERLYAMSGELNGKGQSIFYGKTGGVVVTGNEDGIKNVAKTTLYGLQHLGYTIPPQADCGWIGEAGPGPSYSDNRDNGPVGFDNEFTQRNATIMTWNLMHLAALLREAGGIPSHGNDRNAWSEGKRFGFRNPTPRD